MAAISWPSALLILAVVYLSLAVLSAGLVTICRKRKKPEWLFFSAGPVGLVNYLGMLLAAGVLESAGLNAETSRAAAATCFAVLAVMFLFALVIYTTRRRAG